jgi:A/G-specific adenine glycosylase
VFCQHHSAASSPSSRTATALTMISKKTTSDHNDDDTSSASRNGNDSVEYCDDDVHYEARHVNSGTGTVSSATRRVTRSATTAKKHQKLGHEHTTTTNPGEEKTASAENPTTKKRPRSKSNQQTREPKFEENLTNVRKKSPQDRDFPVASSSSLPAPVSSSSDDPDTYPLSSLQLSLLHQWAEHNDDSFHDFSPEEAKAIRLALLPWYRTHRRKLPWRGDPPPYNGSTAGWTKPAKPSSSATKTKKKQPTQHMNTISQYLTTTSSTKQKHIKNEANTSGSGVDVKQGQGRSDNHKSSSESKGAMNMNACPVPVKTEESESKQSSQSNNNNKVTAYGVWVSEIMLQQTRVEAVIPYYLKWMARFPTVQQLASASEDDVNAHWAGLGFYRRARLLHQGAKKIMEVYDGNVPTTVEGLLQVDGIGPYTAHAVASIAFGERVPVVDGNVCRVLARLRGIANHIKAPALKDDMGWRLARQLVKPYTDVDGDTFSASEVNQALMELGATYCAPSGTGVDANDPLRDFYWSTKLGQGMGHQLGLVSGGKSGVVSMALPVVPDASETKRCRLCDPGGVALVLDQIRSDIQSGDESNNISDDDRLGLIGHAAIPIPPPKKSKREEVIAVAAISTRDTTSTSTSTSTNSLKWLMVKRPSTGLLAKQWEFPSVCVWTSATTEKTKTLPSKAKNNKSKSKPAAAQGVPSIPAAKRRKELDALLSTLMLGSADTKTLLQRDNQRIQVPDGPLEHIFSHVRHTMWVEFGHIDVTTDTDDDVDVPLESLHKLDLKCIHGRDVRWMSEQDMKVVGTTSQIQKVLDSVKKHS